MKIIFFAGRFWPLVGGVEKHCLEVGKMLVEKGHRVVVATEGVSGLETLDKKEGIEIIRFPLWQDNRMKKFKIWKWFWENRKIIEEADVIHCHDVFYWYLPFRFLYPHKKVYTTFHGYESYPISKKAILIRKISEKLSFGNICIGEFIQKWYGTKADIISYGGVEIPNSFAPHPTPLPKEREKRFVEEVIKRKGEGSCSSAVFIGRLDEQTGIRTYVEAARLVKEKIRGFEFTVVGDGIYRKEVEKEFPVLGWKKNIDEYLITHRFAFVSRYLSMLESFANKRLVFAVYDNPVKKDYLELTPFKDWIIIASEAKELAEKVEYYIAHPKEERELIEKAYQWVRKQTWENMVRQYLSLWGT